MWVDYWGGGGGGGQRVCWPPLKLFAPPPLFLRLCIGINQNQTNIYIIRKVCILRGWSLWLYRDIKIHFKIKKPWGEGGGHRNHFSSDRVALVEADQWFSSTFYYFLGYYFCKVSTQSRYRKKLCFSLPFFFKRWVSELGFNIPPFTRSYGGGPGLKSQPKDRRSGGSILRPLDW